MSVSSLILKIKVHGQRRIGERRGQWCELPGDDDGALRGLIESRVSARTFDRGVGQTAVALNDEPDDHRAWHLNLLVPVAPDFVDHQDEVVGTAEVCDVKCRSRTCTAAG